GPAPLDRAGAAGEVDAVVVVSPPGSLSPRTPPGGPVRVRPSPPGASAGTPAGRRRGTGRSPPVHLAVAAGTSAGRRLCTRPSRRANLTSWERQSWSRWVGCSVTLLR